MPGLSKETFLATRHTCRAIAQLSRYLLNFRGFNYVLLGRIQSDNIEGRFRWIRQLSGANYFISMRQLLDSEKKIKAISLLKFSGLTVKDIDKALLKRSGSSTIECDAAKLHGELLFNVVPEDSDSAIIYYISGYCARSLVRTNKCTSCKESLVLDVNSHVQLEGDNEVAAFLIEASRGGLWEPQQHLFQLWSFLLACFL